MLDILLNNSSIKNIFKIKGNKNKIVLQIHPISLIIIGRYNSTREAERLTGINSRAISNVCNNKRSHAGGYYWRYLSDFIYTINNEKYIRTRNINNNTFSISPLDFCIGSSLIGYIQPCFIPLYGEIFLDIKEYEGLYKVSNYGRVISLHNKPYIRLMIFHITNNGYYRLNLFNNSIRKHYFIHRLVAEAFIPNINNYPCINHIDENKLNNNINNLEWCTVKYNNNYGTAIDRRTMKLSIPIERKDLKIGEITRYKSMREAERITGIHNTNISAACNGKYKIVSSSEWKKLNKNNAYDNIDL